jgi:catalase
MAERWTLTSVDGAPIVANRNSLTAGPGGPVLTPDDQLLWPTHAFNRWRITEPDRPCRRCGTTKGRPLTDKAFTM